MTAVLWMLGGAVAGAVLSLVLYLLGGIVELFNCACHIVSCNCEGGDAIPWLWNGESFLTVLLFCSIGGAIIGLVYGICKMKSASNAKKARIAAENSEEAKKQRVKWAKEAKQRAVNVYNTCERNESSDKPLVSTTYQSNQQMRNILIELTKAVELQGKVDSITDELSKKDGAQR